MLAGAAFIGGAINSVAGGGSFLSFPALLFVGVPPIVANATNNTAMWVGVIGSARGYRREIAEQRRLIAPLFAVSLVGATLGALLLLRTPSTLFEQMVPWLLLGAVVLFAFGPRIVAAERARAEHQASWVQLALQFVVAIYGGYFGAGMGYAMLALLAFFPLPSVHAANGIKNALAIAINGIAIVPFAIARVIWWPQAMLMAVAAMLGGYVGARLALRVSSTAMRAAVIVLGITMAVALFIRGV